ncbi:MAG: hypothetical protein HY658_09905 [Actinobacteria bacterium]|nr:hypothetical protein [Actinomycetota bacterium]
MAVLSAAGVAAALVLVYGIVPRLVFPPPRFARDPFDRILIDLVRMTALAIALVHVLVGLRLLQTLGLVLVLTAIGLYTRIRAGWAWPRRRIPAPDRIAKAVLIVSEAASTQGNLEVKRLLRERLRGSLRRITSPMRRDLFAQLGLVLPLLAVLAGSLVIRLAYPVTHEVVPTPDSYVHLSWTKHLQMGEMFVDGVYPRGMHAFLTTAAKLTGASTESLIRFAGPLLNTFFVLVIYLLILRATRNAGAALIGAALVGLLGTLRLVGLSPPRQIGTLPQEFAVLMASIGILMALEYAARPERARLYMVGMAAFVVAISHPLGPLVLGAGLATVGPFAAVTGRGMGATLRLWWAGIAGTLVGTAYIPLGIAVVGSLERNPVSLNPFGQATQDLISYRLPLDQNPIAALAVLGALAALLHGLWQIRTNRGRGVAIAATSSFVLVVVALSTAGREVLHPWWVKRWDEMTSVFLPVGIGLGLATLLAALSFRRPLRRVGASVALATAIVGATVVALPPRVVAAARPTEYESAAVALDRIIASHERYEFAVVGTPEWHTHVLLHGYHVHLTSFADLIPARRAVDPAFDIPIPSRWVYFLTEKVPFGYRPGVPAPGVERYQEPEARLLLMQTVSGWLETYARYHDDLRVWYEDDVIRIWVLDREPNANYTDRVALL